VAYANWITRVGAYLVDALVTLPFAALAVILDRPTATSGGGVVYWIFVLLAIAVSGYNRWWLAGKTGQSWGKKAVSIWLFNDGTRQPIGAGKAFLRDVAHIVDSIICYIGYLFPLWDAKRQTLADKIVRTVVVKG
jgi:uncharacterized RDD family membrane protein YckC